MPSFWVVLSSRPLCIITQQGKHLCCLPPWDSCTNVCRNCFFHDHSQHMRPGDHCMACMGSPYHVLCNVTLASLKRFMDIEAMMPHRWAESFGLDCIFYHPRMMDQNHSNLGDLVVSKSRCAQLSGSLSQHGMSFGTVIIGSWWKTALRYHKMCRSSTDEQAGACKQHQVQPSAPRDAWLPASSTRQWRHRVMWVRLSLQCCTCRLALAV